VIGRVPSALFVFCLICAVTLYLFMRVPGSLVPDEDQCHLFGFVTLDEGASLKRTERAMDAFEKIASAHPLITSIETYAGIDLLSGAMKNNSGSVFLNLLPWDERSGPEQTPEAVAAELMQQAEDALPDGSFILFPPPPIEGISLVAGFEGFIQNRGDGDSSELAAVIAQFMQAAEARPEIDRIDTTFRLETPQYRVEPDLEKAYGLGVSKGMLFSTMQSTFGSYYINDFNKFGRTFKVMLQAKSRFRSSTDNLRDVFVRSDAGQMIPLSSLVRLEPIVGTDSVERFNAFPAGKIVGSPAPGFSSGQALQALEEISLEVLPQDYALDWIGTSYQEKLAGNTALFAFLLAIIVVFFVLAAQYERWTLPLAVIAGIPFALFGSIVFIWLRGIPNDIYFQIALITLIALSAKNAILIVEFALKKYESGMDLVQAAVEAARLRFRPIVMTSMTFVLGCMPLVLSSGAGAASRHSMGTGIVGGMLASTFIATFFVPLFFVLIMRMNEKFGLLKTRMSATETAGALNKKART